VRAKPVKPGANRYEGTTTRFNGKTYQAGQFTVYAVTTDRYAGTTRTPVQGPYTFACR
jgi:hypothetical protein